MSSPLLKEVMLLAGLLLVSSSLAGAGQVQEQTQGLRQDTRRTQRGQGPHRGHGATLTPVDGGGDGDDTSDLPLIYTDVQIQYFDFCETELLSDEVIDDGIISQDDFASKLAEFCETFTVDNVAGFQCPEDRFSSLDVNLQLIFAFGVCRDDDPMVTQLQCLQGLLNVDGMGMEFGYMVTTETMPVVEMDVYQLCFRLFPFVFRKFPVWKVRCVSLLLQFLTLFFVFSRRTI
jgi:hypothetical protein